MIRSVTQNCDTTRTEPLIQGNMQQQASTETLTWSRLLLQSSQWWLQVWDKPSKGTKKQKKTKREMTSNCSACRGEVAPNLSSEQCAFITDTNINAPALT